jgi:SDR family mycofactocin-dependent oxidoreductase
MNRLEGKVALITGVARGQGRAAALRLAREGADVVGLDISRNDDGVKYALGTAGDLAATREAIEKTGRKALVFQADVRDRARLDDVVAQALSDFGGIDIVLANAGVSSVGEPAWEIGREDWDRVIDINLTGVWQTVASVIPSMIARGTGGSIICTSSTAGHRGYGHMASYVSSKHGVEGLVKTLANELGPHAIRVNALAPGLVNTPLFANDSMYRTVRPDAEHPTASDVAEVTQHMQLLPIPHIEADDIAAAVAWLASDDARCVTGSTIVLDGGQLAKAGW